MKKLISYFITFTFVILCTFNVNAGTKIGIYNTKTKDGGEYGVCIEKIKNGYAEFSISYVSSAPAYRLYATETIRAKIKNNTCKFNWEDSWCVKGTGVLKLGKNTVTVSMKVKNKDEWSPLQTKNKKIKWSHRLPDNNY